MQPEQINNKRAVRMSRNHHDLIHNRPIDSHYVVLEERIGVGIPNRFLQCSLSGGHIFRRPICRLYEQLGMVLRNIMGDSTVWPTGREQDEQ